MNLNHLNIILSRTYYRTEQSVTVLINYQLFPKIMRKTLHQINNHTTCIIPETSYICVLWVSFLPLSMIGLLNVGIVPTVFCFFCSQNILQNRTKCDCFNKLSIISKNHEENSSSNKQPYNLHHPVPFY
jgi:hypothetical protein